MTNESCELKDNQVKPRKTQKNWFKTLSKRRKTKLTVAESVVEETAPSSPSLESSEVVKRNVFQRFKKHMIKRFSVASAKDEMVEKQEVITDIHESTSDCSDMSRVLDQTQEVTANFSSYYHTHLASKWLKEPTPNNVMYQASTDMLCYVWYWGDISRKDAQKQLTDKPNGSFLVRDSETIDNHFTLSFRIGNHTLHYRLKYYDNFWNFEDLRYLSIVEMINDIINRSKDENFVCFVRVPNEMQPPFPVLLKFPVSRYIKMPKLQDLARRIIQNNVEDLEKLNCLPIPIKLVNYLHEVRSEIV